MKTLDCSAPLHQRLRHRWRSSAPLLLYLAAALSSGFCALGVTWPFAETTAPKVILAIDDDVASADFAASLTEAVRKTGVSTYAEHFASPAYRDVVTRIEDRLRTEQTSGPALAMLLGAGSVSDKDEMPSLNRRLAQSGVWTVRFVPPDADAPFAVIDQIRSDDATTVSLRMRLGLGAASRSREFSLDIDCDQETAEPSQIRVRSTGDLTFELPTQTDRLFRVNFQVGTRVPIVATYDILLEGMNLTRVHGITIRRDIDATSHIISVLRLTDAPHTSLVTLRGLLGGGSVRGDEWDRASEEIKNGRHALVEVHDELPFVRRFANEWPEPCIVVDSFISKEKWTVASRTDNWMNDSINSVIIDASIPMGLADIPQLNDAARQTLKALRKWSTARHRITIVGNSPLVCEITKELGFLVQGPRDASPLLDISLAWDKTESASNSQEQRASRANTLLMSQDEMETLRAAPDLRTDEQELLKYAMGEDSSIVQMKGTSELSQLTRWQMFDSKTEVAELLAKSTALALRHPLVGIELDGHLLWPSASGEEQAIDHLRDRSTYSLDAIQYYDMVEYAAQFRSRLAKPDHETMFVGIADADNLGGGMQRVYYKSTSTRGEMPRGGKTAPDSSDVFMALGSTAVGPVQGPGLQAAFNRLIQDEGRKRGLYRLGRRRLLTILLAAVSDRLRSHQLDSDVRMMTEAGRLLNSRLDASAVDELLAICRLATRLTLPGVKGLDSSWAPIIRDRDNGDVFAAMRRSPEDSIVTVFFSELSLQNRIDEMRLGTSAPSTDWYVADDNDDETSLLRVDRSEIPDRAGSVRLRLSAFARKSDGRLDKTASEGVRVLSADLHALDGMDRSAEIVEASDRDVVLRTDGPGMLWCVLQVSGNRYSVFVPIGESSAKLDGGGALAIALVLARLRSTVPEENADGVKPQEDVPLRPPLADENAIPNVYRVKFGKGAETIIVKTLLEELKYCQGASERNWLILASICATGGYLLKRAELRETVG